MELFLSVRTATAGNTISVKKVGAFNNAATIIAAPHNRALVFLNFFILTSSLFLMIITNLTINLAPKLMSKLMPNLVPAQLFLTLNE